MSANPGRVREIVRIDCRATAISRSARPSRSSASRRSCASCWGGTCHDGVRLAPDVGLDIAAAEAAYHRARQREVWRRRLLPAVGIGAALLIGRRSSTS
jgi:hypothetical protein